MALESLRDPLSNLGALPTTMKLRTLVDNAPYWDADAQYYKNDVVLSPETDGAYIMAGGPTSGAETAVRGGDDPSVAAESDDGAWWSLALSGLRYVRTATGDLTGNGAAAGGGDFAVPAILSYVGDGALGVTDGSVWKVHIQFVAASAAAWLATDTWYFRLTPSAGVAVDIDVWPGLANPNQTLNSSVEAVVVMGAGATGITLTANRTGASACTFNGVRVTYSRIL